jgi:hypothetical protein
VVKTAEWLRVDDGEGGYMVAGKLAAGEGEERGALRWRKKVESDEG